MQALPEPLLNEVEAVLAQAGRQDLVVRLQAGLRELRPKEMLTSTEAAALLGVSSPNTVKNWLEGGHFPGAFKTAGGHWRFPRDEVEAAKARMDELRAKNRRGDLTPPEADDEDTPPPPLL